MLGLCRAAAQHHTVIGVAHQLTHPTGREFGVEHMQVDVGQQRRDHPALRSARDRPRHHPINQHTCLQPLTQQFEHPPIRDPPTHQLEPMRRDIPDDR